MVLFYVGCPKTGSSSLKDALNLLGFEAVHCHQFAREVIDLAEQGQRHPRLAEMQMPAVLDFHISRDLRALQTVYPEARFIALERDTESIITSALTHVTHSRKTDWDKWQEISTQTLREECEARRASWRDFERLQILELSQLNWQSLISALCSLGYDYTDPPSVDFPRCHTGASLTDRMLLNYSTDWVSSHAENWSQLFGHLRGKEGIKFLEIGSHEGRSARWWLENILTGPGCHLTCIDPWYSSPASEAVFDRSIISTGKSHQVKKIKGRSHHQLPHIQPGSLHGAYIDGSHRAKDVMADALGVLRLMRPGGVILFDDYQWTGQGRYKKHQLPKVAINHFLEMCADEVTVVHRGYQLAVKKEGAS